MSNVITPSEAFAAYERAFRAGNRREVEELLREMLHVQVGVVRDKDTAEGELSRGKRLKTVSVPYSTFLGKLWNKVVKTVYRLEMSAQKGSREFLVEVEREDIHPNFTYVLIAEEAGYSPERGLTFEGSGVETGFECQPNAETREKTTSGRFQTWEEHAEGVWACSKRIVDFYRPFIERWAEGALGMEATKRQDFVDSVIWSMRMAIYLHDVGKLNKKWQKVVWENERKISGRAREGYIARTSAPSNTEQKKELTSPPPHAPFAYPFLRTLLRKILGDYRFIDMIALAAARHHSLEVTGAIPKGEFEWDEWNGEKANEWLRRQIRQLLNLSDGEIERMCQAIADAAVAVTEASEADEPPGPTNDFYFLYCIANRLVKICDWEDAGNQNIELR